MNRIASVSNNKIKQIVKLANSRSYRNELGLAVIYGQHLVEEAQKQDLLDLVFIDQSKFDNNSFLQHISPEKIYLVNDIVLAKINISDSKTDIIGLIRVKSGTNNSINESDCVILDNIQDPGNLGTIFRSCAACGVVNVILSKSCVDPYNIKVLRASQGMQFGLNILVIDDIANFIDNYKYDVIATMPEAIKNIYTHKFSRPCAWLFGNEGNGVSSSLLNRVNHELAIPMKGKTESLNVAMAATVCLFEMVRQRYIYEG